MPTNIIRSSVAPVWSIDCIRRPAIWVVFPLLLGLVSIGLAVFLPAYRDVATMDLTATMTTSP